MNVYDTANKLASEIKTTEEYKSYKIAKEAMSLRPEIKEQIQKFETARYEVQLQLMQTGKNDEQKLKEMQSLYIELMKLIKLKKEKKNMLK